MEFIRNLSIKKKNAVGGQTAQGTEETASAAAQLAGQAQELKTLVSHFQFSYGC